VSVDYLFRQREFLDSEVPGFDPTNVQHCMGRVSLIVITDFRRDEKGTVVYGDHFSEFSIDDTPFWVLGRSSVSKADAMRNMIAELRRMEREWRASQVVADRRAAMFG
jgi:hypothetical protein